MTWASREEEPGSRDEDSASRNVVLEYFTAAAVRTREDVVRGEERGLGHTSPLVDRPHN
jgi:hypothetical protein